MFAGGVFVLLAVSIASGSARDGRVLGQDAGLADFPWQATVEVSGSPRCSASILHPGMVLTAAHCVMDSIAEYITVRVGTPTLNSGGDVYQAAAIYVHQSYQMFRRDYDVSLLPLASNITLEAGRVEAVALPANDTETPQPGVALNVTGWSTENGTSADALQVSEMVVVNQTECVDGEGGNLTERMLCVAGVSGAACRGDDGGPATIAGVQFGIVSIAPYDCDGSAVLVNLAEFYVRDWIRFFSGV